MKSGCYTALVTPFIQDGSQIDRQGLEQLAAFQIANNITGILAVGTTGESPTLAWDEHNTIVEIAARLSRGKCLIIAGAGSNNTREALTAVDHAAHHDVDAVLLVDPYYNGPSSLEIRREYISPVARRFPDLEIIPYVIPGRTGAQLLPEDLALLNQAHPNVASVKEATADLNNMRRTRECCGPDFSIFSGDDSMTMEMMNNPDINAAGVISVASNVAPKAMSRMVELLREGDAKGVQELNAAVSPLFDLVTVKTKETTPWGDVVCRARNPLAIKTFMALLGMPAGPCRPPLGKMSRNGFNKVLGVAEKVWAETPEILKPIETFFGVDIAERLNNPAYREGLYYETY